MVTGSILILIICTLILFWIIGLFNKKIGDLMKVVFFYLKRLRVTRQNLKRLPKTVKKIYPVLKHRPTLLINKLNKNYRTNQQSKTLSPKLRLQKSPFPSK